MHYLSLFMKVRFVLQYIGSQGPIVVNLTVLGETVPPPPCSLVAVV